MIKALLPLASMLVADAAMAAGTGPEIAYVKSGSFSEIYLVEPDGTRLRQLYRSKQRMRIFALDMRPGGGELAFEEVGTSSSTATLKVLRYDNSGTLMETKSLPVCRISSLDYQPSAGGDLLYKDTCAGTQRLDTMTMTSTDLAVPAGINKVNWRSETELIYNRSTPNASEVLVAPLSDPSATSLVGELRLASSMDISTSGSLLLVDPVDFGTLSLFDMSSGAEQKDWQIGHHGRFSPDDLRVAYVTGHDVRGQYIMIRNLSGSGSAFRLAGKGVFGPIDWRN